MAGVNSTLARGLAGDLTEQLLIEGDAFYSALQTALARAMQGSASFNQKRANKLIADLHQCGRKAISAQFVAIDSRKTSCIFFASRGNAGHIDFTMSTLEVDGRHGFSAPRDVVMFRATRHALERLYLRLRTLDFLPLATQLGSAMVAALNISRALDGLGVRQVAIPTTDGAFICTVDEALVLTAVTWLSDEGMGARWGDVTRALRACPDILNFGTASWTAIAAAMKPFAWLKEEYVPRTDPKGERWAAARAQSGSEAPDEGKNGGPE